MALTITEHLVDFTTPNIDRHCQTYYKQIAAKSSPKNNDALPMVIVHGGPFLSHHYCLPLQELAHDPNIAQVVFYDEIGCGSSTAVTSDDKNFPENFWPINVSQLKSLLDGLGLPGSGFYLYGHSMGGMVATIYAAQHPEGIKGLILANTLTTIADMRKANLELFKLYPPEVGDTIINFEEFCLGQRDESSVSVEQWLAAGDRIYKEHFNRAPQPSEYFVKSMELVMGSMDVFATLAGGKIRFLWSGPISRYDTKPLLHRITAPTLVMKGEFDETLPFCQEPFLKHIQRVEEVMLKGGSHIMTDEVPDDVIRAIGEFIGRL